MMSDMTRTVVVGKATDEMKRVYDLVRRANEAGRRAARPGAEMREIDFAARKVIEDAGYGKYFIHRLGHGIGLEVHEPMDASATNARLARAGMTFSVEPGIYLPGKFGVRIEDLVCVTEDGCETLNELGRELIEL
jgi:Xaa-Pro dipeptidase